MSCCSPVRDWPLRRSNPVVETSFFPWQDRLIHGRQSESRTRSPTGDVTRLTQRRLPAGSRVLILRLALLLGGGSHADFGRGRPPVSCARRGGPPASPGLDSSTPCSLAVDGGEAGIRIAVPHCGQRPVLPALSSPTASRFPHTGQLSFIMAPHNLPPAFQRSRRPDRGRRQHGRQWTRWAPYTIPSARR